MSFEANNPHNAEPKAVANSVPAADSTAQSGYLPKGSTRTPKPWPPELKAFKEKLDRLIEAEKKSLEHMSGSGPAVLPNSGEIQQREETSSAGVSMPKQTSVVTGIANQLPSITPGEEFNFDSADAGSLDPKAINVSWPGVVSGGKSLNANGSKGPIISVPPTVTRPGITTVLGAARSASSQSSGMMCRRLLAGFSI